MNEPGLICVESSARQTEKFGAAPKRAHGAASHCESTCQDTMAVPTWLVLALLEFIVLGVFAGWMVRFYASKSSPFYSLLTVFVAW